MARHQPDRQVGDGDTATTRGGPPHAPTERDPDAADALEDTARAVLAYPTEDWRGVFHLATIAQAQDARGLPLTTITKDALWKGLCAIPLRDFFISADTGKPPRLRPPLRRNPPSLGGGGVGKRKHAWAR